jgi:hypothetical protein
MGIYVNVVVNLTLCWRKKLIVSAESNHGKDRRLNVIVKSFFGLQVAHFTGPKKLENSRAQPPPTSPRYGYARIQNIMHGAVKIIGA